MFELNRVERNSAHELLRIIAMFLIVWYHLIGSYLYLVPHDSTYDYLIEAAIPTLHIGVILFLLISGYYGIKPSVSGFLRLVLTVTLYYLPLQFIELSNTGGWIHPRRVLSTLQFITNTPYWFVRTYLFLYLVSPILNKFIHNASDKAINLMLAILGIISIYFGTTHGDPSLSDGKNLVNFMFLYLMGYSIRTYKRYWESIRPIYIVSAFIVLNVLLIVSLSFFPRETNIGDSIWRYSVPYCSPILLLNAILVFIFFSKLTFHSSFVNSVAASTFAVYLIHCQPIINQYIKHAIANRVSQNNPTYHILVSCNSSSLCFVLKIFIESALFAAVIMTGCIIIDKLLNPLWKGASSLCLKVEYKILKHE